MPTIMGVPKAGAKNQSGSPKEAIGSQLLNYITCFFAGIALAGGWNSDQSWHSTLGSSIRDPSTGILMDLPIPSRKLLFSGIRATCYDSFPTMLH